MKLTEQESEFQNLDLMPVSEILDGINTLDTSVPLAVGKAIPAITTVVEAILPRMQAGGRLFYIGAGTSGRLGIVDASECPPTFGVPSTMVNGIIAGGDGAIRKAVEFAEDDTQQGWIDLQSWNIGNLDSVIGITASGTTPYVIGALTAARDHGIWTGGITCNPDTPLAGVTDCCIEVLTGPEFLTGSTRMKAGTAQKLVLNMISTTLMIRLGRVQGNRMVNMQLSNQKLIDRGTRMVVEQTGLDPEMAQHMLLQYGSVKKAVEAFHGRK